MNCAWLKAPAANSSLQANAGTPNRVRAWLWALSTVWRSNVSPRSAGAGQLELGSVAAETEAGAADAISRARANARFIGGDFAPIAVNKPAVRLGKDQGNGIRTAEVMATLAIPRQHPNQAAACEPLALYVHWPFCVSKCPYCDFNS